MSEIFLCNFLTYLNVIHNLSLAHIGFRHNVSFEIKGATLHNNSSS